MCERLLKKSLMPKFIGAFWLRLATALLLLIFFWISSERSSRVFSETLIFYSFLTLTDHFSHFSYVEKTKMNCWTEKNSSHLSY